MTITEIKIQQQIEDLNRMKSKDRIIRFLQMNDQFDYTVKDIARCVPIHYNIVKSLIRELLLEKQVMRIRTVFSTYTYQIPEYLYNNQIRDEEHQRNFKHGNRK